MLLGIDGGASSTKWALFSADGAVLRQGRLGSMTGHLFSPEDEAALRSRLADLADTLESRPGAVVAGISGLQGHAGPIFRAALADTFGLPERLIRVVNDLQLAYAAHFPPGEGVLVYAGTGSVACFYTPGGELLRAGEQPRALVVAGAIADLTAAYRGITVEARRSRCGLRSPGCPACRMGSSSRPAMSIYLRSSM